MVVLQTFLGLIIIYFVFCVVIVTSSNFDINDEKGFMLVSGVIGYIVALLIIACIVIFVAHGIGSGIL